MTERSKILSLPLLVLLYQKTDKVLSSKEDTGMKTGISFLTWINKLRMKKEYKIEARIGNERLKEIFILKEGVYKIMSLPSSRRESPVLYHRYRDLRPNLIIWARERTEDLL